MSDIPMFSAKGSTDAEKVQEIISYLSNLSSAVDRELLSIDFSNLNSDLANRINKSVTEHQDLSAFASKNYTKNNFYNKETIDAKFEFLYSNQETHSASINDIYSHIWRIEDDIEEIKDYLGI